MSNFDTQSAGRFINEIWDEDVIPRLVEYIRIPNKSPHFDPDWEKHGYMEDAVQLITRWCKQQQLPDMQLEIVRLPGRTPLIFIEIPGHSDETVLLYGHLDKQPEMTGWRQGLGPWEPVIEDDKLYGRGGADDGYSVFCALTAIRALHEQGASFPRCVVMIEACEESGSTDLPAYLDHLSDRLQSPNLIVCLDSGVGNYEQLWVTTSLRGQVTGVLSVDIIDEGVHSGNAGGVVPSSFQILRLLLDRLEDSKTGRLLLPELHVEIPSDRQEQAKEAAKVLGDEVWQQFPFKAGAQPIDLSPEELVLNRTWRPSLEITGADGMPLIRDAGNVLRPRTAVKLSMRLPPTCDAKKAAQAIQTAVETKPPFAAKASFRADLPSNGWEATANAAWLETATHQASQAFFGKPALYMGEGATIPFADMLGKRYPQAQFLVIGVLGPQSNAHGPNEFLHIPTAKRLTGCLASVLLAHHQESS